MARGRTLKELAQELGVSVTTVSRALAGHEQIAPRTRERVAQAAREMGYVPNRAAQALVSGRTGFAGFVLPIRGGRLVDPFLGEFVTGLTEGFAEHGMDLLLAAVAGDEPEEAMLDKLVDAGKLDGIVLNRISERDPRIARLMERDFPFVAHGRLLGTTEGYAWIDTDGEGAFAQAFAMLHDLGHRHFALLTIEEPMTFRRLREKGLRDAIARCGDPAVRLDVVSTPRFAYGARAEAAERLLRREDRPTAVLGLFDGLAIAALEAAARLGLSVPGDLSVIGFDNTPPAGHVPPGLTTFDARIAHCAQEAARMLVEVIRERPARLPTQLVTPEMVTRASHGPAPAARN